MERYEQESWRGNGDFSNGYSDSRRRRARSGEDYGRTERNQDRFRGFGGYTGGARDWSGEENQSWNRGRASSGYGQNTQGYGTEYDYERPMSSGRSFGREYASEERFDEGRGYDRGRSGSYGSYSGRNARYGGELENPDYENYGSEFSGGYGPSYRQDHGGQYSTGSRQGGMEGRYGSSFSGTNQGGTSSYEPRYGWSSGGSGREGFEGSFSQTGRKGPKNYKRSKDRIEEDVNRELTMAHALNAEQIDVQVDDEGNVTLKGTVESRREKRLAEDMAESVWGVTDVKNELKVSMSQGQRGREDSTESSGSGAKESSRSRSSSAQNR